jgi:hypothetical protein
MTAHAQFRVMDFGKGPTARVCHIEVRILAQVVKRYPHGFAAWDQTFDAMSMCSTSLMLGPLAIYIMDRLSRLRAAVPAHQEVQWQFREHGEGTTLDRRVGLCPHRYSQEEPQI